jgi:prepilin-type N-terminal cleavage/methylation domain-containing protein
MSNSIRSIHEPRRADAGFTLVEVLISIIVLVFGLIAVTNLFLVAGSSNAVANQATASTDVAAGILEGFKSQSWNTLTPVTMAAVGSPQRTDTIVGVGPIYSYWSITDVNDASSAVVRTKLIRVRSEGASRLSRGRSRAELTTYRTCTTPALGCP